MLILRKKSYFSKSRKDSEFQVKIDNEEQNILFENNRERISAFRNQYELNIKNNFVLPHELEAYKTQRDRKPEQRDVAKTNHYLFVNYTPIERLILHEYSLEKAKSVGYPLENWNQDTFLNNDDLAKKEQEKQGTSKII